MTAAASGGERERRIEEVRAALSALFAAERRYRARSRTDGDRLPLSHVRALLAIETQGTATAGDLAIASDLRPASVTAMLDHLSAEGLVQRRRSEEDARCAVITLTEAGSRALAERKAQWLQFGIDALSDRSDEELEAGVAILRALAEGINAR